jgi:serine/threonine protein kinase
MSPEQIQGQPLDGRSDVFAIGVVLYELCSDQQLFQRDDTVATFYAVVRGEVPPLRSVCPQASELLEMIVHKALAKDPNQRFQSAADLAAELDQVVLDAGGRFSNISAIARFLSEWGINLSGAPPVLLSQLPKPLLLRRDNPSPSRPASATSPEVAPGPPAPPVQKAPGEPPAPPGTFYRIRPPAPGTDQRLRTPGGRDLRLHSIALRAPKQHTSVSLPLHGDIAQGLLPAPISLIAHGTTLMVELLGPPIGRGRDRPSLYHDAYDPNTRCESYTLLPITEGTHFDVGHRRSTVQRVYYASALAADPKGEPLSLRIQELMTELEAEGPLLRLCALHITDAEGGLTHLILVIVSP